MNVHLLPATDPMARLRAVPRVSKPLFLTFAVIALLALVPAAMVMIAGGVFRSVRSEFAGTCGAVAVPGGVRDIQVGERGVAYLSVRDRDTGNGTVMLLDLNLANPAPRAAMSHDPRGFRPEGISVARRGNQPAMLFAVSSAEGDVPAVEIARQDAGGAFVPASAVRDPLFGGSSLVSATEAGFYVVDHRPPVAGFRRTLGLLTRSGDDRVVFHDGARSVVVADGLAWVSGLGTSADGTRLYVAEMLKQSLRVYRRAAGEASLELERTVSLGAAPSSLSVDADGVIWLTTQPKLLRYFAALDGAREATPSQVMRLDPRQPEAAPAQVFLDDGAQISAGTSVAKWRGQLVIGSRLDNKVLICKTAP